MEFTTNTSEFSKSLRKTAKHVNLMYDWFVSMSVLVWIAIIFFIILW